MKKCIVLANGNSPKKSLINYLYNHGFNTLYCADGGANTAYKLGLIPDCIIGDLDSINPSIYDYYYDRCKIIFKNDQNSTDIEKCLNFLIKKNFRDVILLGATGNRLDHTFCNIGIVHKFFSRISVKIIHEKSILFAYGKDVVLKTIPKEIISIYGIDKKTKILSKGLKYPLGNIALPFGKKESTSNVALDYEVHLRVKHGLIFVIRDFETMKKHDLF